MSVHPISSEQVQQAVVVICTAGLGFLFPSEDADIATCAMGGVVGGAIGVAALACIDASAKWYANYRMANLREIHNTLLAKLIEPYKVAPRFPIEHSQIDDRTMERALEKIKGFKSYRWKLKEDKVDSEKVLEYWKKSISSGTCVGQVSALLHGKVNENEAFSLKNSFESLTPEEIISRHCARSFSAVTLEKKVTIASRFKAKQIACRTEQWEKQLVPLLQQACLEFDRGIPQEECFRPLKQWARERLDPHLEQAIDKVILAASRSWYQRKLSCWLGIRQEWKNELVEWIQNPPEISAADKEVKLRKYEEEEKRLAQLEPFSWPEVFEYIDMDSCRRIDDMFLIDSPPEVYQMHLEKAIASFPSRTRDGVITGTIFLLNHVMAFQYGPEEYFIYDSSLEQHGMFKYPNKACFFNGMSLIVQNNRYLSNQNYIFQPKPQNGFVSFHLFKQPEPAP